MKSQRIFPGVILIGFGAYFFLEQSQTTFLQEYLSWPTLLMIVGIAFLFQGYMAKDYEAILPGVVLTGFGLHFNVVNRLEIWPNHIGTFILIIALGFLLRYQKVKAGLFQGLLFLFLSIFLLFYDKITQWFGLLENGVTVLWKFWPAVLIFFGCYFLFIRKK